MKLPDCKRPVFMIGYGVQSYCQADICMFQSDIIGKITSFGIPILSSWQAADLIDNDHWMYFGRPGVYGQRRANEVLYGADVVIAIGNRMSPWQVGYTGLRPDQKLYMVDIDPLEVERVPNAIHVKEDIEYFLEHLEVETYPEWIVQCDAWNKKYPLIEEAHKDNDYMNSYRVVDSLHQWLREDEVIVTDVGGMMCPPYQVLRLKPPQRLMTSGGLGEMGCGLPAAIGASFAREKGQVLCLVGDGGMMLNLQELQTIVHHKLPIKILLFDNRGYAMIKHTQKNLSLKYTGVDKDSGTSFPNFRWLAQSFGIQACDVHTWEDFNKAIGPFFDSKEPSMIVIHMDPEQKFVPKLEPTIHSDGRIEPAQFNIMSPIL